MATTTLSSEEKEACREEAAQHLTDILQDKRSPYDDGEDLYEILNDLVSTRDEFRQVSARIQNSLQSADAYVVGFAGRMNSLGVLQSDGSRIDALAMLFQKQVEYAKRALVRYYTAKAEQGDDETETCPSCGSDELLFGVGEDDLEDGTFVCESCQTPGMTKELARHLVDQGDEAGFDSETIAAATRTLQERRNAASKQTRSKRFDS